VLPSAGAGEGRSPEERMTKRRPIGATILAVLAGVALLLAIVHLLQALGIVPYFVGSVGGPGAVRDFSLWYTLMWGLMIWVWVWVIQQLWVASPEAWLFLLIVSGFNMMFDFINMAVATTTTSDLTASFILNLVIFGYTLLPSTKRGFSVE
jgi:hypothetical protein